MVFANETIGIPSIYSMVDQKSWGKLITKRYSAVAEKSTMVFLYTVNLFDLDSVLVLVVLLSKKKKHDEFILYVLQISV